MDTLIHILIELIVAIVLFKAALNARKIMQVQVQIEQFHKKAISQLTLANVERQNQQLLGKKALKFWKLIFWSVAIFFTLLIMLYGVDIYTALAGHHRRRLVFLIGGIVLIVYCGYVYFLRWVTLRRQARTKQYLAENPDNELKMVCYPESSIEEYDRLTRQTLGQLLFTIVCCAALFYF